MGDRRRRGTESWPVFSVIRVIRVIRGGCFWFPDIRQVGFKETQHALTVFVAGDLESLIVLGVLDEPQFLRFAGKGERAARSSPP